MELDGPATRSSVTKADAATSAHTSANQLVHSGRSMPVVGRTGVKDGDGPSQAPRPSAPHTHWLRGPSRRDARCAIGDRASSPKSVLWDLLAQMLFS